MAKVKSALPDNVVDSSAWLEYLAGGAEAGRFADVIEDSKRLILPAIVLYEDFKKVLRAHGEQAALLVAGAMHAGNVVPVDAALTLDAARYALPMADSLIYATAQRFGAIVWTQDADFKGLPGVNYFPKLLTIAYKPTARRLAKRQCNPHTWVCALAYACR